MKILFIISSSIAVIKCEEIFKILKKNNIHIDCILTEKSKKFINYKKLKSYISGKFYTDQSEKKNKMLHIELSRNANLIVVCPATANTIAKYANGYADNLATTTLLASSKQVLIFPAMNSQMWNNNINQKNVNILSNIGVEFIGPKYGTLSCGEVGLGRLVSVNKIVSILKAKIKQINNFNGKKCLVTAGATLEELDPVRFISNYSSGKQGFEIANQLAMAGGKVTLISGQTNLQAPHNVKLIKTNTTKEMFNAIKKINKIDIGIFSAAVCDFKPKKKYNYKLKKNKKIKIDLINNIDILKYVGNNKKIKPKILVGFSAETGNISNAKKKLIEKNCDLMIYNKINNFNKVFNSDYNKISIISKNKSTSYKKMTKTNCAKKIINAISIL